MYIMLQYRRRTASRQEMMKSPVIVVFVVAGILPFKLLELVVIHPLLRTDRTTDPSELRLLFLCSSL